jgi:hypothetical protein
MEAIGHHEFGKGLKPVNFDGWLSGETGNPEDLSFWLRYWTAAYQFILGHAGDTTVLVSYARLTEEPETALSRLAGALDLPTDVLAPLATELRPPRSHSTDEESLPGPLLEEVRDTYGRLDDRAAV